MTQKRAQQRDLKQKPLDRMTQKELLQTFFKNGDFMVRRGFAFPKPPRHEDAYFSLNMLWTTKGGRRLLRKTSDAFRKGKIDQNGQPVKSVKVTRRKAKIKKTIKGGKK